MIERLPLLDQIRRWIKEPPPEYLFEVSERSLAWLQTRDPSSLRVERLEEKALAVSPSQPNFVRFDLLESALPKLGNGNSPQRRAKAALVIPDYAARLSVLEFEELPSDLGQLLALIRFRLRKSVPFAIDEAQVSCSIQWNDAQQKKMEVLAAAIARPVLEEYETLLRSRGFQAGLVVPSSIAALPLCPDSNDGLVLFAKLSGSVLSILLVENGLVRVVRCVDLSSEENNPDEEPAIITTLVQQTLAFAEDELAQPVKRLLLCGFNGMMEELGPAFESEFGVSCAPLLSRRGEASQENAGLLGLAEQFTV
jgi:type IV pilus assembly protein PilM